MQDYILSERLCTDSVFSNQISKSCLMIQVPFASDIGQWLTENNLSACNEGAGAGRRAGGKRAGARWISRKLLLEWMEALSTGRGEWKRGAKFGNWKATRLIEAATKRERQKNWPTFCELYKGEFFIWEVPTIPQCNCPKRKNPIYAPITSTSKVNYSNITAQSLELEFLLFLWWLTACATTEARRQRLQISTLRRMFARHLAANFSRRRHAD